MNRNTIFSLSNYNCWTFLFLAVIFTLWNFFTPLIGDDYAYSFFYAADSLVVRPTSQPINSIPELFESQWNHYCCVNGRFTSHLLIQFFLVFTGKFIFNIVNAFVAVLFIKKVCELISKKHSLFICLVTLFFFCLFLPFPGQTILWLTGSINYLWTVAFSLFILDVFQSYKKESPLSLPVWVLYFAVGVFVGWMNESITIGMAGGCFFYFLFHRNHFVGVVRPLYLGYLLGALLIVFSPGTFARMDGGEVATSLSLPIFISSHGFALVYAYVTNVLPILPWVVALVLLLCKGYGVLISALQRDSLLVWIYWVTTAFLFMVGLYDERIYFGISVFGFILAFRLFRFGWPSEKPFYRYVKVVLGIYLLLQAVLVSSAVYAFSTYTDQQVASIQQAPQRCILSTPTPFTANRFCYAMSFSADRHNFHNRVMSFYYGKDFIQYLPDEIYQVEQHSALPVLGQALFAASECSLSDTIYRFSDKFWILPIDESQLVRRKVKVKYKLLDDLASLSSRQKLVRAALNSLQTEINVNNTFYFQKGNQYYYVLPSQSRVAAIHIPLFVASEEKDFEFFPVSLGQ